MPLRVAIISPTFGAYGGLEAFVLTLAAGLPLESGSDVRIFFKRTAGFRLQPALEVGIESLSNRTSFVNRGSFALIRALAWADVVHAQNPSADTVLGSILLRRPVLMNVINHRLPGRSVGQRLWDYCLRRADRRFYISEFVRQTWEGTTTWPGSEVVFPICRLADGVKVPGQRNGFIFAGRWIANKGVDTLVEAYAQAGLDPAVWPLTIIGDGPLRTTIERRVRELALRGLAMPGFLSETAKAEAIRSARFMVIPPNTREDFGLTAIEARHAGVPCIITRDGGLPEAAGNEALSCEPGSVADLATCLRAAAAMPAAEYARRSEATRATLAGKLRPPAFYDAAYRELHRIRS